MTRSSNEPIENSDPEIERAFHLRKNLAKLKDEIADNIERLSKADVEITRLRAQFEANAAARNNAQANQQNLQYN